ncbi:hypothetical protein ACVDG3_18685 [Meridianimarinicoccus sp. RP-17]|uniref:hypothetical protein n=1 Tax=Meridianimarinicoccus zhengii TaxID=2056810 RepID=UPI0013A6C2DC|nr:hypothetical protein [Phycocomes zhengii]
MTNTDSRLVRGSTLQKDSSIAAEAPLVSRMTDIASVASIMELRYRPARSAGSAHLMIPAELNATISEVAERAKAGVPNARQSLLALRASRDARRTETDADRAWRLRQRIAWELAQEKKEIRRHSGRLPASWTQELDRDGEAGE